MRITSADPAPLTERRVVGTITLERSGAAVKVAAAVLQFFDEQEGPESAVRGDVLRFTARLDIAAPDAAADAARRRMRDALESGLLRAGVQGHIHVGDDADR